MGAVREDGCVEVGSGVLFKYGRVMGDAVVGLVNADCRRV